MENKWIKVEDDNKPDVLESVLCHLKNGYIKQLTYGRLVGFFDPESPLPVSKKNPVTHWMKLPEPPANAT